MTLLLGENIYVIIDDVPFIMYHVKQIPFLHDFQSCVLYGMRTQKFKVC